MKPHQRIASLFACLAIFATFHFARADDAAQPSLKEKNQAELTAAANAAQNAAIFGPKDVPVAGQAVLHLPEGYFFVPQPEAGRYSRAIGNGVNTNLVGVVTSQDDGGWLAYLEYLDDGHVNDDDAKTWNADDLLKALQDGTEAGNADRQARGFRPIEVARWIEVPSYDDATRRLVWSALVKNKNDPSDAGSANYNTYALGRDGHFELNLVASVDKIDQFKQNAKKLLGSLEFSEGRRYADYNANTDRLAEYGLAALIGGVAVKKLGLLAIIGAFILKFAKLAALGGLALVAGIRRFFGGARSNKGAGPGETPGSAPGPDRDPGQGSGQGRDGDRTV